MKLERPLLVFLISGAVAFVVDAGVTLLGESAGMPLIIARATGFLLAANSTWLANRTFGFQTGKKSQGELLKEWSAYLAMMVVGAAVNLSVFFVFTSAVKPTVVPLFLAGFVDARRIVIFTGVAAGTLAGMTVNYFSSRRILSPDAHR